MPACELIVCLVALAWWIAAATTATVYGKDADNVPPTTAYNLVLQQKEGYRTCERMIGRVGWVGGQRCELLTFVDCCCWATHPPRFRTPLACDPPPIDLLSPAPSLTHSLP